MKTVYVSTEWVIFCLHHFHFSSQYPFYSGGFPFCRILSSCVFFLPFIMLIGCMFHAHAIKFPINLMLGAPPPILAISSNTVPWFLDVPGFNVVNFLNITIFGIPHFSVIAGLGYVSSSSLYFFNDISFSFYNLDKIVVNAIIFPSLGFVLVHYFAAILLLSLLVVLWTSSCAGTSVNVSWL